MDQGREVRVSDTGDDLCEHRHPEGPAVVERHGLRPAAYQFVCQSARLVRPASLEAGERSKHRNRRYPGYTDRAETSRSSSPPVGPAPTEALVAREGALLRRPRIAPSGPARRWLRPTPRPHPGALRGAASQSNADPSTTDATVDGARPWCSVFLERRNHHLCGSGRENALKANQPSRSYVIVLTHDLGEPIASSASSRSSNAAAGPQIARPRAIKAYAKVAGSPRRGRLLRRPPRSPRHVAPSRTRRVGPRPAVRATGPAACCRSRATLQAPRVAAG